LARALSDPARPARSPRSLPLPPPLQHPLLAWLSRSASPEDTARSLGAVLPLQRLESLGPVANWWHLDGHQRLGPLPMVGSMGSPLLLEAGAHPRHWLLLLHDGFANLHQGRHRHELNGGDGLIVPGLPWTLLTQDASCSLIAIDAMELLAAARDLGGPRWHAPDPRRNPLRALLPLSPAQPPSRQGVLLSLLQRWLPIVHEVATSGGSLLESLLLQEQLYRLLALLVFPELISGDGAESALVPHEDPRLDSLLDFIGLHLDQPLTLQQLEDHSNYSRRTLHHLFQQRFGCSPMQWIRQLRMAQALERLSHPAHGDTVKRIASECGYRSLSQFGLDFQRSHARRPSDVLRAGRSAPADPPPC
jgi:AraC-like DNA-binding protein